MAKAKPEETPQPIPVNRAMTAAMVKVRAVVAIGETVDGDMCRFSPGEEFEIPAERLAALGSLVEKV